MMTRNRSLVRTAILTAGMAALNMLAGAQQAAPQNPRNADLERHIDMLSDKIDSMRQQLEQSQQAMDAMRTEIESLRSQLAEKNESQQAEASASSLRADVLQLQEKSDVLESEVRQHDQTKIESLSKYPVRLSGTLLFTSIASSGATDNLDLPLVANAEQPDSPSGNLTATARQSILGIDASGPHLWGASSSAAISVDFFGGIPYADYTTAAGTVRMRTAHATLAWQDRSLTAAFEQPIVSPRNPTSWITVGEPALSWSGNLWTWSPQLDFRENSLLPGGHLTGEFAFVDPAAPGPPGSAAGRMADPSESSRQPGYEARLSEDALWHGHEVGLGAGGYYSRQAYGYEHHADAWAGTADWKIAPVRAIELSGEFYRGRAIGGLGGGTFKDYATYNNYATFRALDAEGGWAQARLIFSPELEANVAMGQDNAFATELRNSDAAGAEDAYETLARNQTAFANFVYRPRAWLLFSAEYRQIRSWPIDGDANHYHMFGLAAGYLF